MIKNKNHNQKVSKVQKQIRWFYKNKQSARIYHGGTNTTRHAADHEKYLDISHLDEIIEVNQSKKYAVVEPNVSLGTLVGETLKHNLLPPVVSEFPAITIGGAIQGGAGESSSFKVGCVDEICLESEIMLGSGRVVDCSPRKNKELFYNIGCSLGTIGVTTALKIRLVEAKKYVRLDYHRVKSISQAVDLIKLYTNKKDTDFVDGIMFSNKLGVIMVGKYSDNTTGLHIRKFHRFFDQWFFMRAKSNTLKRGLSSDLIPIKDYLFRYDRGAFWVGIDGVKSLHLPFFRSLSIVFASFFKTKNMYRYLHMSQLSQKFLIQDICLPSESIGSFFNYLDKTVDIYPLWLCPLKPSAKSPFAPNNIDTDIVINIGVWGLLPKGSNYLEVNRDVENKIQYYGGKKVLYAHTYYPKRQFWQIYDQEHYTHIRQKYFSNIVFPDIYSKVKVSKRYKPARIKGLVRYLASS